MRVPPLLPAQVHVVTVSLDALAAGDPHLARPLAPDERARGERFATPLLRQRHVAARAMLRRLLAAYQATDAASFAIGYGARGKPCLPARPDLCFNLSHAGGTAIYAFASGRDVGVDIEATARAVDVDGVARTAFSPPERDALAVMGSDARRAAFFRIWTRKEAYVKLLGDGLGYPTRSFSVSYRADDDALVDDEKDAGALRRCRIVALPAPTGFAAALAAAGRDWSVVEVDAAG
jgi:4'-phosphopantetheinyl transferase